MPTYQKVFIAQREDLTEELARKLAEVENAEIRRLIAKTGNTSVLSTMAKT
jgi:hypothetical protein